MPAAGVTRALSAFLHATGQLAAAAVECGDRAEARRLLSDALRALDARPSLRVVTRHDGVRC